jgi:hypothetical protein
MDWYLSDNNLILIIVVVYDVHEHQQLQKYFILIIMIKRINLQVVDMIRINIITFNIAIALHEQICVWILIYIREMITIYMSFFIGWIFLSFFLPAEIMHQSIRKKKFYLTFFLLSLCEHLSTLISMRVYDHVLFRHQILTAHVFWL